MASKDDHNRCMHERFGRPVAMYLATLVTLVPLSGLGCQRVLTIQQDDRVNNAMYMYRENPEDWRGDPLHVDIVCVTASDLKDDRNARLAWDSTITCKEWYERRPKKGNDDSAATFQLPSDHIFMLSDDDTMPGKALHRSLRGALDDGKKPVKVSFSFPGKIHDRKSVIFVFPRFTVRDGSVLPVPPVRFDPPGAFKAGLAVKIGVLEDPKSKRHMGQYIKLLSERKLHGKGYHEE